MADNPQGADLSIRTPRARVKGLGASGHGAGHFWIQRLTGAANAVLMLAFACIIALMWGRSYDQAVALIGHPVVAILLLLAVLSVTVHMRLGMQTVIEDYLHAKGLKLAAVLANDFYTVAVGVACLYAIVSVGLA